MVNPVNSVSPAMPELYKKKGQEPIKTVVSTALHAITSDIVRHLADPGAELCPNALGRTFNPVNNVLPAMELHKKKGLEPMKTVDITTLIPAGMPRSPGITRDELPKSNSDIARHLVDPVNSVFPAMELYDNLQHKFGWSQKPGVPVDRALPKTQPWA